MAVPTVAFAQGHAKPNWFSQFQLGYQYNVASNEQSSVNVVQGSGANTQINYANKSSSASPSFGLSGGYQFHFKNHWLLNVGEGLQVVNFDVKGQASSAALSSYDYKYDVNALALKTFMQLIYRLNHWQILSGLNVGLSVLGSNEYGLTSSTVSESFDSHTSYHLAYGAEFGFGRVLDKTDTVNFIVNYENLGTARSGQRHMAVGSNSGVLYQKMRTLGFFINLTHQF